jgi:hypothetical protein
LASLSVGVIQGEEAAVAECVRLGRVYLGEDVEVGRMIALEFRTFRDSTQPPHAKRFDDLRLGHPLPQRRFIGLSGQPDGDEEADHSEADTQEELLSHGSESGCSRQKRRGVERTTPLSCI